MSTSLSFLVLNYDIRHCAGYTSNCCNLMVTKMGYMFIAAHDNQLLFMFTPHPFLLPLLLSYKG